MDTTGTTEELEQLLNECLITYERLNRSWRERFQLSANEKLALAHLWARDQRMTQGELSEEVGVSPPGMTSLADRLERSGFIRRIPDPIDRRRTFIELTTAGRESRKVFQELSSDVARAWERRSTSEREVIVDFLSDVTGAMAQHAREDSAPGWQPAPGDPSASVDGGRGGAGGGGEGGNGSGGGGGAGARGRGT